MNIIFPYNFAPYILSEIVFYLSIYIFITVLEKERVRRLTYVG
jgi:hypothetical protein